MANRYASVGAMTPRLVHDLNNLLSVANGYLELTGPDDAPGMEHLAEVRSAVAQMSDLLRSMRILIQGNPGQDAADLVAEWRPALALALGDDVRLEIDPGQFAGIPMADSHSLQSALACVCLQAPALLPVGGTLEVGVGEQDGRWTIRAAYLDHTGVIKGEAGPPFDWWQAAVEFAHRSGMDLHRRTP